MSFIYMDSTPNSKSNIIIIMVKYIPPFSINFLILQHIEKCVALDILSDEWGFQRCALNHDEWCDAALTHNLWRPAIG